MEGGDAGLLEVLQREKPQCLHGPGACHQSSVGGDGQLGSQLVATHRSRADSGARAAGVLMQCPYCLNGPT